MHVLVEAGADVRAVDDQGLSALLNAVKVRLLTAMSLSPSSRGVENCGKFPPGARVFFNELAVPMLRRASSSAAGVEKRVSRYEKGRYLNKGLVTARETSNVRNARIHCSLHAGAHEIASYYCLGYSFFGVLS